MGELRGGYIPGNLSPEEQAQANRLLYEQLVGSDRDDESTESEPSGNEPADEQADQ